MKNQEMTSMLIVLLFTFIQQTLQACPAQPTSDTAAYNNIDAVFTPSSLEQSYSSSLQGFFNLANSFLNTVQPKSPIDALGVTMDSLGSFDPEKEQDKIIKYEIPMMIAVGFGALFFLLFPIVGMCFCCCRCCGNCGGKMEQNDKASRAHCCCFLEALCMLLVTILILCGVLFMFFTNSQLYKGVNDSEKFVSNAMKDVKSMAKSIGTGIDDITQNQVPCAMQYAKSDLSDASIKSRIGVVIQDRIRTNVSQLLKSVEDKKTDMSSLINSLDQIESILIDSTTLRKTVEDTLSSAKTDLDVIIKDCEAKRDAEANVPAKTELAKLCQKMNDRKGELPASVPKLPTVDIATIKTNINKADLSKILDEANSTIDEIPQIAVDKSKSARDSVIKAIDAGKKGIDESVGNLSRSVNEAAASMTDQGDKIAKDFLNKDSVYMKYYTYAYYVYIGLSAVVALVVLLLFFGLVFGSCGYRKDASPMDRSGTATCGGNFLMSSVGFMFIFSWILMLFCFIWFALGIHMHIMCRETKIDKIGPLMKQLMPSKNDKSSYSDILSRINFEDYITNCRNNKPIYIAIGGQSTVDINKLVNISAYTQFDVLDIADGIDLSDQKLVTDDMRNSLTNLDISDATKDYSPEIKKVTDLTTGNTTKIDELVKELNANPKTVDFGGRLDTIGSNLKNLMNTEVAQLKSKISVDMKTELDNVKILARGFKQFATDTLKEADKCESFIHNDLKSQIVQIIEKLSARIIGWFTQLIRHFIDQMETRMWKCAAVPELYVGVHVYFCDNLIQNMNGFWMALGWCLLFFVPAIIFAVKLAKYYRRMKYLGDEEDGEHYAYNPDYETAPREEIQMKDVNRSHHQPPYNPVPHGQHSARSSPKFKNAVAPDSAY